MTVCLKSQWKCDPYCSAPVEMRLIYLMEMVVNEKHSRPISARQILQRDFEVNCDVWANIDNTQEFCVYCTVHSGGS